MNKERVVIPVTQEEMRDLLDKIILVCQRSRSIISENMELDRMEPERGVAETWIADLMHPHLYPDPSSNHVNLIEAIMRTMDNREIEPINIYNLLILVEREPIIYPTFKRSFPNTYLPTAQEYIRAYSDMRKREAEDNVKMKEAQTNGNGTTIN